MGEESQVVVADATIREREAEADAFYADSSEQQRGAADWRLANGWDAPRYPERL
jgi:hypothetical protein